MSHEEMQKCHESIIALAVSLSFTSAAIAQQSRNARAPAYFRDLAKRGNVELTFHDPQKHPSKTGG